MSASMINLVLWIPFALVFVISGILFLIAGYRRGVLNALVSMGGTIAAAAVSLGIGKLVAIPLAPVVMKLLPDMDAGATGAALPGLAEGAAAMVVAMVLFMVLMLILTPVCKKTFEALCQAACRRQEDEVGRLGRTLGGCCTVCIAAALPHLRHII